MWHFLANKTRTKRKKNKIKSHKTPSRSLSQPRELLVEMILHEDLLSDMVHMELFSELNSRIEELNQE